MAIRSSSAQSRGLTTLIEAGAQRRPYVVPVGRFNLRRSVGEKPIVFKTFINSAVSADLDSSPR